jgi:hypothetical protein
VRSRGLGDAGPTGEFGLARQLRIGCWRDWFTSIFASAPDLRDAVCHSAGETSSTNKLGSCSCAGWNQREAAADSQQAPSGRSMQILAALAPLAIAPTRPGSPTGHLSSSWRISRAPVQDPRAILPTCQLPKELTTETTFSYAHTIIEQ